MSFFFLISICRIKFQMHVSVSSQFSRPIKLCIFPSFFLRITISFFLVTNVFTKFSMRYLMKSKKKKMLISFCRHFCSCFLLISLLLLTSSSSSSSSLVSLLFLSVCVNPVDSHRIICVYPSGFTVLNQTYVKPFFGISFIY